MLLNQDCAKSLDINAIEATVDNLLEHYRQALRAVEFLPEHGPVPRDQFLVQIAQPATPARGPLGRLRRYLMRTRTRNADWIKSTFAIRSLARMFLKSHIQSKLRSIVRSLEVERLSSGYMDASSSAQLSAIIEKLRDYDKSLADKNTLLVKASGWVWRVLLPAAATYVGTCIFPPTAVSATGFLAQLGLYIMVAALIIYGPLFVFGELGGFRWKRLILLGRTGDVNISIATDAVVTWVTAPQKNTYQIEDNFFDTLGLPKPTEFPWDAIMSPVTVLSTSLALAFLCMAVAMITASSNEFGWPSVAAIIFVIAFFLSLNSILRSYSRVMIDRRQRGVC
jgi:hypothetical protein